MGMKLLTVILLIGASLCAIEKGMLNSVPLFQENQDIMNLVNLVTYGVATVKRGEPFIVELPSNPSTGYEWTVEREKLKIVNHVDKELVGQTKSDDSGRVGAPGKQLFTFMPKSEGMDTIVFLYRKNWEPNDRSTIYNLRVNVE
eukprot:TRINITY_DN176_c0_g1_i16.p2 TRINITY_DN176_c0_g1~~TRINITY_DN176_c0_g1_i16.p2  ORF type:complete len:144 (-),score=35.18 TRINITY_DN176_c0_g1_i16:30-461(-)